MENFLVKLNAFLWGAPVLVLLFAVGVLYSVKTRFFQFRHFKHIMKSTAGEMFKKGSAKGDGTLTPLQAVSSAFFYIFPKASGSNAAKLFIRLIWLIPGFISLGKTPELVWTVVDIVSGFWCIPNAIALLFLSGTFMKIFNDYNEKYILQTRSMSEPLK